MNFHNPQNMNNHHSRTKSSDATRCVKQRSATSYANSSAFSDQAHEDEDWTQISDLSERRRIQNRIAQRNYRQKQKKRMADLERHVSESVSPEPELRSKVGVKERPVRPMQVPNLATRSAPTSTPEDAKFSTRSSYETVHNEEQSYLAVPADRYLTRSNSVSSYNSFETQGTGGSSYSQSPSLSYSMPSPELPGTSDYREYISARSQPDTRSYPTYFQSNVNTIKPEFYREEYPSYSHYGYGADVVSDANTLVEPSQLCYSDDGNEYQMTREVSDLSDFSDMDVSDERLGCGPFDDVWSSYPTVASIPPTFLMR